jgi:hypothetical protein
MRIRASLATLCLILLLPAADARAEWNLGGSIEYFQWKEDTAPITVREGGPLFALRTGFSHPLGRGFHADYRGRFYLGEVAYDGSLLFAPSVPATGSTRYLGTTLGGQLRHGVGPYFDVVGGLLLDLWHRRLGTSQVEDYRIVSVRFGAQHAPTAQAPWLVGAGLNHTLSTHENAHLTVLGFEQNPPLEPGSSSTPYFELGYSFARRWSLVGSIDGFDFGRSNQVIVTQGNTRSISFQPASTMQLVGLRLEYRSH